MYFMISMYRWCSMHAGVIGLGLIFLKKMSLQQSKRNVNSVLRASNKEQRTNITFFPECFSIQT